MLKKIDGQLWGPFPTYSEYYQGKSIRAKLIMPLTKWLRVFYAKALMLDKDRHLDIGCGDGYFIKKSCCKSCWGMDIIYGDKLSDLYIFSNNFFDYVTMLAVIEHLNQPLNIFSEIHRILKPDGRFIFTTPKEKGEWLMRIYSGKQDLSHENYYDLDSVLKLSKGLYNVEVSKLFLLGYNQLFSLKKL